mgnify:CR=1 FL=1
MLFHGPHFQVIDTLKGVGEEGIVGQLKGTEDVDWNGWGKQWRTDPALLDGGLQLALLLRFVRTPAPLTGAFLAAAMVARIANTRW